MSTAQALAAALLWAASTAPTMAQAVDYHFTGTYNTSQNGVGVALGYTGSFTITDPVLTPVKPAYAADVSAPSIAAVWSGDASFYTGATALHITFANGATLSAPTLDLVVNNTTFSGSGSPYPLGQSVQLYAPGTTATGMTASLICPNGTVDTVCDDSGVEPLFRQGDAADLALQRVSGVYFAFWGAPLSTVAAGVPQLVDTFGIGNGGLGVYSSNELGQPVTTLTSFQQFTAVTSAVPEPANATLMLAGLAALAWRRRSLSAAS
jgi:hypothetical protein